MDTLLTWIKRLALSKTIVMNILALALLVTGSEQIKPFITTEHAAQVLAVINIILRFLTSGPLSEKAGQLSSQA